MKGLFYSLITALLVGCSTDEPEMLGKTIALTIKNTDTVKYEILGGLPVEGGPEITDQAKHYKVSELVRGDSAIYYLYVSDDGFTGTETVEITHFISNGSSTYDERITKFTIKVTE